jgi:hypothetical protein
MIYLNNFFQKNTLKDPFLNALKKLKTWKSNEDGSEKVILQSEKVLT